MDGLARPFDLPDTTKVMGAFRKAGTASANSRRCSSHPRHLIPKRNLSPSHIYLHRTRFFPTDGAD